MGLFILLIGFIQTSPLVRDPSLNEGKRPGRYSGIATFLQEAVARGIFWRRQDAQTQASQHLKEQAKDQSKSPMRSAGLRNLPEVQHSSMGLYRFGKRVTRQTKVTTTEAKVT